MNKHKLRDLILECYVEVLREQEDVLPTSTQEILGKFPTLKKNLNNLLTSEYENFVNGIDWVAPKPTTFRINLVNGEQFYLKWTGKGFESQIGGKKYYLDKTDEFQQALDKLNELLKYNPMGSGQEGEGEVGGDEFGEPTSEPTDLGIGGPAEIPGAETSPEPGGGEGEIEFEEPET